MAGVPRRERGSKNLNLQQKFLLLFSDYRTTRDDVTRLGDEVVHLRAQLEDERKRFDELTERYVGREEKLNDRMLETRFGAPRERREETVSSMIQPADPRKWAAHQRDQFRTQLLKRAQQLNSGSDQSSTRTN